MCCENDINLVECNEASREINAVQVPRLNSYFENADSPLGANRFPPSSRVDQARLRVKGIFRTAKKRYRVLEIRFRKCILCLCVWETPGENEFLVRRWPCREVAHYAVLVPWEFQMLVYLPRFRECFVSLPAREIAMAASSVRWTISSVQRAPILKVVV